MSPATSALVIAALLDSCPGCDGAGGAPVHPDQPCADCGRNCWQTEDQKPRRQSFGAALSALESNRSALKKAWEDG